MQGDYGLDLCKNPTKRGTGNCYATTFDCAKCGEYQNHTKGLENCPFCGGRPFISLSSGIKKDELEVTCHKCHVSMKNVNGRKLVASWNRRKPR